MDVVYRYRASGDGNELKYSLRSLKNVPHDNVWIIGDKPHWLPREINHIPAVPRGKNKWERSRNHILKACNNSDISDDFILMDDDFFIVKPVKNIGTYHRGLLSEHENALRRKYGTSRYIEGFPRTRMMLEEFKVAEPYFSYELHIPMVINKHKMQECLHELNSNIDKSYSGCFHTRSWYGNYWQIGGLKIRDVKVYSPTTSVSNDAVFLSSSNNAFNPTRSKIRLFVHSLFPR